MKKILFLLAFLMVGSPLFCLAQSNDGNGGGAVRIQFGGGDYVAPRTLSGDDPAMPPKPKKTYNTNSIVLNQILESTDDFELFNTTLENFQKIGKVMLSEEENCSTCFMVVYNLDSKNIVAVMDKGNGKRMNLLSNKFETNDLYSGENFGKIRFQIDE